MPKRRLPGSSHEASIKALRDRSSGVIPSKKFIGLSLSGGKSDKTGFALVEYFPDQKKVFLSSVVEQIRNEDGISSDMQIHKMIESVGSDLESVAVDAPLTWPKCLQCRLKCPGFETCTEPEIKWMSRFYNRKNSERRPFRFMTPYTERCTELYWEESLEEKIPLQQAMGSNRAPLTARIHYLKRRLKKSFIEVAPKISFWRLGLSLGMPKSKLRLHRHWEGGEESRKLFIEALLKENLAFIYEQDRKALVEDQFAFDAFIGALTGLMKYKKQTESRPRGFPAKEGWIEVPKPKLKWP